MLDMESTIADYTISYLEKNFSTVHTHRIHGAKGHEGDRYSRRSVHCIVVAAKTQSRTVFCGGRTLAVNSTVKSSNQEHESSV